MKLSTLYSTAPFKRMGISKIQPGASKDHPFFDIYAMKKLPQPNDKGRSIMGFKRTDPGNE
jgi:hypothetical protein